MNLGARSRSRSNTSISSMHVDWWDVWGVCDCFSMRQKARMQRLSVLHTGKKERKNKHAVKTTLLTGQQRLIVMRTWHKVSSDISTLGISTMLRLLDCDKTFDELFGFQGKKGQDLLFHPRFRQHAFWLIQAVSATVENIDDLDLMLSDMFIEIGEKHAAIPTFSSGYFLHLPKTWAYVWEDALRDRYTVQTDSSWSKIFDFIVELLTQGCRDQMAQEEVTMTPSSITTLTATPSSQSVGTSTSSSVQIDDGDDSSDDSDDEYEDSFLTWTSKSQGSLLHAVVNETMTTDTDGEGSSYYDTDIGTTASNHQKISDAKNSIGRQTPMKSSLRKSSEPTSKMQPQKQQQQQQQAQGGRPNRVSISSEPLPGKNKSSGSPTPTNQQRPPSEEPTASASVDAVKPSSFARNKTPHKENVPWKQK